jgi:hypothetical protein
MRIVADQVSEHTLGLPEATHARPEATHARR